MTAYYNEHDPQAAAWLRNLIAAGHIAHGVVDERSIEDVRPDELTGYVQCHFFAGIGVWSHALRKAGWPDDRPVWTGSCPCQPFSAAGEGVGFADERHLWPAFFHLIGQCRPVEIFGEQVASKDAEPWLDLVHADLESLGYTVGAIAFPASSVGAPNIRDRLYWMGNAGNAGLPACKRAALVGAGRGQEGRAVAESGSAPGGIGNAEPIGPQGSRDTGSGEGVGAARTQPARAGTDGWMADTDGRHTGAEREQRSGEQRLQPEDDGAGDGNSRPGPLNGFWRDADWLLCRDGRWRPAEPGTFPLVAIPSPSVGPLQPGVLRMARRNRVIRLRGYGNAINASAAGVFIEATGLIA